MLHVELNCRCSTPTFAVALFIPVGGPVGLWFSCVPLVSLLAARIQSEHATSPVSSLSLCFFGHVIVVPGAATHHVFFTLSMNILFLLPGSSRFSILCPVYPLTVLCTCSDHLSLDFLTLSPNCPT